MSKKKQNKAAQEKPKQVNQNFKGDGNPKLEGENRPAT
ncbi:hypothetical protein N781_17650 [Pontibacillus halophilus JSM 076056 = DSM 19796]|uniref:Uncharacterized protein n=1 Tax=Pontibacillus halophilus JSM 076056 = DSM 19796 TaxID=1385510 RepID=A0A0A5GGA0_9BACI|nr:hypothetical protein N781_17650 [Pontibacillus halophilus JSM 076056 = DSM 19796]